MDVNSIASLATQMSQQKLSENVSIAVLKKTMDIQKNNLMEVISSIPDAANLPSNLGQNINTSV